MSDFSQYESLFKTNTSKPATIETCQHKNIIEEKNVFICDECGEEVDTKLKCEQEWRYYKNDNRYSSDPKRVQLRKSDNKSIAKELEGMGFKEPVLSLADNLYNEVTEGDIFRGKSRSAIISACVFQAFKLTNNPKEYDTLVKTFNLEQKIGLKGLKYVNINMKNPKYRTEYITPAHLIVNIMANFECSEEQKNEVIAIYNQIAKKSEKLNRSKPQSVASGVVYYWIVQTNKNITLKEFVEKVKLSELTITKMVKEIEKIIKKE